MMIDRMLLKATKGQDSAIFTLPPELLLLICDFAWPRDHSNLSRTCRYLVTVLQRHLFRRCSTHGKEDHHEAMLYACTEPGALPVLQRALTYGVPPTVDSYIFDGKTALSLAGFSGLTAPVAYLLRRKANANKAGTDGLTPLAHALDGLSRSASRSGPPPQVEILLRLLDGGADPRCRISDSLQGYFRLGTPVTSIVDAQKDGQLSLRHAKKLVQKFILKGADPDGFGNWTTSPLQWAVSHYGKGNAYESLELLLNHGADPNYSLDGAVPHTALGTAIQEGNVEAMNLLISRGASTGPLDVNETSPLWHAVVKGDQVPVLTLL